jgi:seryl-tRNA synthetase
MADENRFDPSSHDSMFARILAEMEADRAARQREAETDREQRQEFRAEIRQRFDRGSARMDEIHSEVKKTNGRVTRLESARKNIVAKIAGAGVIFAALVWAYEHDLFHFGPQPTPQVTPHQSP